MAAFINKLHRARTKWLPLVKRPAEVSDEVNLTILVPATGIHVILKWQEQKTPKLSSILFLKSINYFQSEFLSHDQCCRLLCTVAYMRTFFFSFLKEHSDLFVPKWSVMKIVCADSIIICALHVRVTEIRSYKLGIGRPIILTVSHVILGNFLWFVTVAHRNNRYFHCGKSRWKLTTYKYINMDIFMLAGQSVFRCNEKSPVFGTWRSKSWKDRRWLICLIAVAFLGFLYF